jgi:hypothetical protein
MALKVLGTLVQTTWGVQEWNILAVWETEGTTVGVWQRVWPQLADYL